jgi:hypothetical protein
MIHFVQQNTNVDEAEQAETAANDLLLIKLIYIFFLVVLHQFIDCYALFISLWSGYFSVFVVNILFICKIISGFLE